RKGTDLIGPLKGNEKRKPNLRLRAHNGQARIAERRKQWDQAEQFLAQLVKERPDDASYVQRLGIALFMQDKHAYADKAFQKARKSDAKLARPEVTEARLYHQQGKDTEAKKLFEKAMAADSKDAGSKLAYAQWLLEMNQPAEAKLQLDAVLAKDPTSRDALLLAGLTATIQKEYVAAQKYLERAHLLAPANASITNHLALALVAQDDDMKRRRAGDFASLGVAKNPKNGDLNATLGWIYYKLGRTAEADQRLNAAIKTGTLSPDSRYLIAQIFFDRGRNAPAKQLLQPVIETRRIFVYRQEAKRLLDRLQD
ncbi:MAG: tetratricopeptide repeat protein, partial [Pirellulales bacterium]